MLTWTSLRIGAKLVFRLLRQGEIALFTQSYLTCSALGFWNLAAKSAVRAATVGIAKNRASGRSLIITGSSRVGKSVLARKLRSKYHYECLSVDRIREYFRSIRDLDSRRYFVMKFYTTLLARFSTGVILEGDEFLYEDRNATSETIDLELAAAVAIAKRCDVKVYILGDSDATVNERVRALTAFNSEKSCWTNELDEVELRQYALLSIRTSKHLRQLADGSDIINYLEVNYTKFDRSINEIADRIIVLNGLQGKNSS